MPHQMPLVILQNISIVGYEQVSVKPEPGNRWLMKVLIVKETIVRFSCFIFVEVIRRNRCSVFFYLCMCQIAAARGDTRIKVS